MYFFASSLKAIPLEMITDTERKMIFRYIDQQLAKKDQGVARYYIALSQLHDALDTSFAHLTNERIEAGISAYFSQQKPRAITFSRSRY